MLPTLMHCAESDDATQMKQKSGKIIEEISHASRPPVSATCRVVTLSERGAA